MFNKAQNMIEEQNPNNSTETAILPMQCYVQCGDNLELLKSQPNESVNMIYCDILYGTGYRDWETDRKSTRLNSSHITRSRMPSSA